MTPSRTLHAGNVLGDTICFYLVNDSYFLRGSVCFGIHFVNVDEVGFLSPSLSLLVTSAYGLSGTGSFLGSLEGDFGWHGE